jgi:hypothetical protein
MQQFIPDELGHQIAELAEGLNLDVDVAVEQALTIWAKRVRRTQAQRLPDPPILDEGIVAPFDLPRSPSRAVEITTHHRHMPDAIELH